MDPKLCKVCGKNEHNEIPLVGGGNACGECAMKMAERDQIKIDTFNELAALLATERQKNAEIVKALRAAEFWFVENRARFPEMPRSKHTLAIIQSALPVPEPAEGKEV